MCEARLATTLISDKPAHIDTKGATEAFFYYCTKPSRFRSLTHCQYSRIMVLANVRMCEFFLANLFF